MSALNVENIEQVLSVIFKVKGIFHDATLVFMKDGLHELFYNFIFLQAYTSTVV